MNKVILVVPLALLLGACFSMPPRADEWTFWKKAGVTNENDVRRIMLECGHVWSSLVDLEDAKRHFEKYMANDVLAERCLEKEGFRYTSEFGTLCSKHPNTPECHLPIEQIPSRDISRRLNGVYCTKFPTAELCKP